MAHERIVVTTDTRNLEGVSPEATKAILANTNPKFRMFIDEYPKQMTSSSTKTAEVRLTLSRRFSHVEKS